VFGRPRPIKLRILRTVECGRLQSNVNRLNSCAKALADIGELGHRGASLSNESKASESSLELPDNDNAGPWPVTMSVKGIGDEALGGWKSELAFELVLAGSSCAPSAPSDV
jgi:hypothetical protein